MAWAIACSGDILGGEWNPKSKKSRAVADKTIAAVNAGRDVLRKVGLLDAFDHEFLAACNKTESSLMTDARPKCDCPSHAVSPSQIDTYRKCPRRWGFRKLALRQEPETTSQHAGKEIHARLEKYALTGELPHLDHDKYARPVWAAVRYLPPPHPGHVCEQHIKVILPGGMVIHGYPDLRPFPGTVPEVSRAVYDYKTVSVREIPFEFALTESELLEDTQGIVYAQAVSGSLGSTFLRWVYIERQKPYRVHPVDVTMSSTFLRSGMASITKTVREMYAHRAEVERLWSNAAEENNEDAGASLVEYVNSLPANTDHCGAYGGCPHRAVCTAYKPGFFDGVSDMPGIDLKALAAQVKQSHANQGAAPMAQEPKVSTNADSEVTAQARQTPQPDPINPPVEDLGEDEHEEELRQMQAALEAKKKQADEARAAAQKAKADAEAAAKRAEKAAKTKVDKPTARASDKPAEGAGESAEPSLGVDAHMTRNSKGYTIVIEATGATYAECYKTLQAYIADMANG